MHIKYILGLLLTTGCLTCLSQVSVSGRLADQDGHPVQDATVSVGRWSAITDSAGIFVIHLREPGKYRLQISHRSFLQLQQNVQVDRDTILADFILQPETGNLSEIVVTGTMKEVRRSDSPVPVEIISSRLFKKNPSSALFDAVGMISGVQPQINCNVCNTGDIRINGMDGPYTLILIDGMPIVSALSTVYGLSGIPVSLIEQVEVVKGPASSLYGSDAMGGIVNVITRHPEEAARLSLDSFATSWGEMNADASVKLPLKKATGLLGINYFNYSNRIDKNGDGFTDLTLQDRISLFNKWSFNRKDSRQMSVAARYVYEDRWGGQMNWNKSFRGGDSIYGESVYTRRWELISSYQLPLREKIMTQLSVNRHEQNSWYGRIPYMANQQVWFAQAYWDKQLARDHSVLAGASYRFTRYDDNTVGTMDNGKNKPVNTSLPGLFLQDEWTIDQQNKLLFGYRFDHDRTHGNVHSPRVAYKWSNGRKHTIRASFGTGYRVVNLFTEDHAALTGSRKVEIREELLPERSYNLNLNYVTNVSFAGGALNIDVTAFYTHFMNKITADLDTDPDKIIYDNLDGFAVSRGISANVNASFVFPLKLTAGATCMDVFQKEGSVKKSQLYAPGWSSTYSATYTFEKLFTIDITGRSTGPMRLPIQRNDFRPPYSPWYSIINIQLTKTLPKGFEVYGGVKNLFNYVPRYALIRAFDPFDKQAADPVNNPRGYTFDTEYNYAPLQGIRGFIGMRYALK